MNSRLEISEQSRIETNDFRWDKTPNPNRAIYILGDIDENLMNRIQPDILKLRHESNNPITVYISSKGGSIPSAYAIRDLLKTPNRAGESCHIITVATDEASSAAANLLAWGDYAIAYPNTKIIYHSSSLDIQDSINIEAAMQIAAIVRDLNEGLATKLANSVINRYIYRYTQYRDCIEPARERVSEVISKRVPECKILQTSESKVIDTYGFACLIYEKLASCNVHLITTALQKLSELVAIKNLRNNESVQSVMEFWNEHIDSTLDDVSLEKTKKRMAIFQALLMKKWKSCPYNLFNFNFNDWIELYNEFDYVAECLREPYSDTTLQILDQHRRELLFEDEINRLMTLDYKAGYQYLRDIAQQRLELLWFYAVTVCQLLLQQQRYWKLHPEEAYWLGLIDEVLEEG